MNGRGGVGGYCFLIFRINKTCAKNKIHSVDLDQCVFTPTGLITPMNQLLKTNRTRSGNQLNQITHKTNRLYAPVLFSPLTLYTFIDLFIHLTASERAVQRAMLSFGGVGLTLKVSEERGL